MESQESQEISPEGNTKKLRARSWFFTWNSPDISASQLISLLNGAGEVNKLAFQLERGDGGNEHYQGVCNFRNQLQFKSLKGLHTAIHWEKCRDLKRALEYCTKSDTRIDGPWTVGWQAGNGGPKFITDLLPWQRELEGYIGGGVQSDRGILWLWDHRGNCGKTAMSKRLVLKFGALFVTGKASDIKYAVAQAVSKRKIDIVVFHFTRSQEEFVSYQAIEEVKDGIFFSTKYESGMCVFDPPTIIIFANFAPDLNKLSIDRWDVRDLGLPLCLLQPESGARKDLQEVQGGSRTGGGVDLRCEEKIVWEDEDWVNKSWGIGGL